MTENFSTGASLELTVPRSELRSARQQIEDEIGEVPVTVQADVPESGSAGATAVNRRSRENAMSRQLLTQSNDHLEDVTEYGEENLQLNQTRNELLQELVNEVETGGGGGLDLPRPRQPGGGGGFGGLGGLGLGLGAGMLALAGLSVDVPDIPPLEVPKIPPLEVPEIPPVPVETPGWIPIPVESPDGSPGPEGVPSPPPVEWPGDVPHPGLGRPGPSPTGPTAPEELPSPESPPAPVPGPSPNEWPGDQPHPGFGRPTPTEGPGGVGMDIPTPSPEQIFGGVLAGGAAYQSRNAIKGLLSGAGSAGVGFPAMTPEMFPEGHTFNTNPLTGEDVPPSVLTEEGREKRLGPAWDWVEKQTGLGDGYESRRNAGTSESRSNQARDRKQQKTEFNYSPTYEINLKELLRKQKEDRRELKRRVEKLERELGGSGSARLR